MPGPSGIGLHNNLPPPINQPGVGNMGGVGNIQPLGNAQPINAPQNADVQPVAGQQLSRASDIAGELDVLLLKAVKSSASGEIDSNAVYKAAKAAKLPKAVMNELRSLAATAQASLKALDAFTGKDLAAAMTKDADGNIGWAQGSAVGKALTEAQDAQEALSSALANALGQAKNAETQATLEEIMLKCDRRIGEIETLVLQMTEIIDKGGDKAVDTAAALAQGGSISSFSSADALDKFGRGELLNALKADLKPLTDRLDEYAKSECKNLAKADIDSCIGELNAVKAKFSAAAASGQVTIGDNTVGIDRSMLGEATKLLDGVGKRLASFQREVVHSSMVNVLEKSIPFSEEEILSPKFAGELHKLMSADRETGDELEEAVKLVNRFRSTARAYVESPTKKNAQKLQQITDKCYKISMGEAASIITKKSLNKVIVMDEASGAFKAAFKRFKESVNQSALAKTFGQIYNNLHIATSQLLKLGDEFNAAPSDKYFVSGAVLDAFQGRTSNSTLIESRVHGYADSDINPAIDDKNVVESKELGSGAFNTVSLVTLKDGSEWVFKPEIPGRIAAPNTPHQYGLDNKQQIARVNLAVQHTADTLGLGDIMVKTTTGVHDGQFGMFMEKAPGMTAKDYKMSDNRMAGSGNIGAFSITQMNDADFAKVVGRVMRKANRLNWFDMITGQADRHADNYMIEIKKSDLSVSLKAIDNDASYGVLRTGLQKFVLPPDASINYKFEDMLDNFVDGAGSPQDKKNLKNAIYADPGLKKDKYGAITVDLAKAENPKLLRSFLQQCGVRNSLVPPAEIDSDLYDKLMTLAKDAPDGGVKRQEYLNSLAEKLGSGSEQFKCAVNRLDEAIAHARSLMASGKVYSAEQWENHDVQRQVAAPNLNNKDQKLELYGIPVANSTVKHYQQKGEYAGYTNSFFRDFLETVTQVGLHKNWFKQGQ